MRSPNVRELARAGHPFDLESATSDVLAYLRRCYPHQPAEVLQDACQDAWLAYLRHRSRLEPEPIGWLCVVARRLVLAEIRRHQARQLSADQLAEAGWEPASRADDVPTCAEAREALRELAELRPSRRRALIGRAIGLSYHELAEATGTTYTAVNRHVTEGRGELRERLA